MAERQLRSRVVCIGKAASERVSDRRADLHEWVADTLTENLCQSDQYDTTLYLGLEDLLSGRDAEQIGNVLARTLPTQDGPDSVLLIDLTANSYDLLPEPLLASVGEFVNAWCGKQQGRLAIVLIPVIPPRESSLLFPSLGESLNSGASFIIANDGTITGGTGNKDIALEGYADRQADLGGSYESRIDSKVLRRLGHFHLERNDAEECARYFFDCSIGIDDIAHAVARYIDRRIKPAHPNLTLLTHGPRSRWLNEVGMVASMLSGVAWQDASNLEDEAPHLVDGSVGVLVLDVVNSGETLRSVLKTLRGNDVKLASRGIAILIDRNAPPIDPSDDFAVKSFATVDTSKVSSQACVQCSLGLPFTDPAGDKHIALRSYDAWEIFLEAAWVEEPYGPTGLHLYDEAPDLGYAIEQYGDYLAYKVELIVKSLMPSADLVFVCPDEPRVRVLIERLGPRFQDRFVAVKIPRGSLEEVPEHGVAQDRAAWRKQLDHLAAKKSATVVVIDEMNASSTTASSLIRLLAASGLVPKAYIPVLNLDIVEEISGVPVIPLYSIPSPRRMPNADG